MITVACVWVKGNVPYTADYVTRLHSMVARYLDREFRFVCLTDRGGTLAELASIFQSVDRGPTFSIAIEPFAGIPGWWSKLQLFNPRLFDVLGERVLYLDLDTLPIGDLAPLVDFKMNGTLSPFALVPPGGNFQPMNYRTVRRYNSSVMVFQPSERLARLFTEFNTLHALPVRGSLPRLLPLWGDQDWIGERMPDADLMPAAWFPRLSELLKPRTLGALSLPLASPLIEGRERGARVVLVKKPKPHEAAEKWPWFSEAWR